MRKLFLTLDLTASALLGATKPDLALEFETGGGTPKEMDPISGTVTSVDQSRRCFKLHFMAPVVVLMHSPFSHEETYSVTNATVYQKGSWTSVANGVIVTISGQRHVVSTGRFGS